MRSLAFSLGLALVVALAPPLAADAQTQAAPSFDCAKASGPVEQAVCADPQLAADDVKLALVYKAALGVYAGADRLDLQRSQRDWLRARVDACRHVDATLEACLAGLYEDRTRQLASLRTSPNAGLAALLWTDGVACEGDRALIRFSAQNDDGTLGPPPEVGGALARAAAHSSACRLADGRVVRFKVVAEGNEAPRGECGGDTAYIYSVWIGDKKVISREERAGKCGANPVRAVYLEGARLQVCDEQRYLTSQAAESPQCRDISDRLTHPPQDAYPDNTFVVSWAAPGKRAFCESLIRDVQDGEAPAGPADPDWPRKTATPAEVIDVSQEFDLNNSGAAQKVIEIQGYENHFIDGDFWVLPPKGMSAAAADRIADALKGDKAGIDHARAQGFQVFAGDQTPYEEPSAVQFTPFRKDGSTWLMAKWTVHRMDLPTQVLMRPLPSGTQEPVCRYQATPDL